MSRSTWLSLVWVVLMCGSLTRCASALSVTVSEPPPSVTPVAPSPHPVDAGELVPLPTPTRLHPSMGDTPPTQTPIIIPSPSPSVSPSPVMEPTLIPLSERQHIFHEVWSIINTNYLYPGFHDLDWQRVRSEFEPKVKDAASNDEFYALLTTMVDRLSDQHSRFLAPGDAIEEDARSIGRDTRVGIGIITLNTNDGAMIQQVVPGSPAEQAGLQCRDRIVAVDGVPCTATHCDTIQGEAGTRVRLTVVRKGEKPRDVVLARQQIDVRIIPITRRLDGDIGYMSIPSLWINDMAENVSGALTDLMVEKPLRGLIIDLRGNPGGWRDVLVNVLSHFVRGDVGTFFNRDTYTPLMVKEGSGPDMRHVPLVVLIDEFTSSYAEVMAGILQTEAGAYVVGKPSTGNTETIYAYELAGGARLWVAQEGFRLRNGVNLEGVGVHPDAVMSMDWTESTEQDDPYILEAVHYLNQ